MEKEEHTCFFVLSFSLSLSLSLSLSYKQSMANLYVPLRTLHSNSEEILSLFGVFVYFIKEMTPWINMHMGSFLYFNNCIHLENWCAKVH